MAEELLFLTHRVPYPPNKGDKIRSFHLLRHLSQHYRVHLGTFVDDEADWQHVDTVKSFCAESHFARLDPPSSRLRSLSGLLTDQALTLPYYRNAGLQHWVNEILASHPVKRILVFSSAMAQYVRQADDMRRVIDFVDVDSDKWQQYAGTKHWPLSWLFRREAKLLLRYEREVAKEFDASLFVSPEEAELFKRFAPESAAKTGYFSNGVDTDYFSPEREYPNPYQENDQALVFTGAMDYWPNVDAVSWFAQEIFPAIHAALPQTRFFIVGSRPTPVVCDLARLPGITVTGTVADVRPYLAHARIAVAPLRIARGLQNKVLEAMAMAKTVVASPQAAEGIQATQGNELHVAASAGEFAQQVLTLLTDKACGQMGNAARARILANYNWDSCLAQVDTLLADTPESSVAQQVSGTITRREIHP
ncbi:glycosyl transferase [Sulfurimicrobium lacus]|uniref:Glycosyl transferase n=1 Tax=Sulfurimicrobium lacus TaxID=2715678 RepID=A0A6F8VCV6_9PROT|nr:TIGR03087 family PEP-CTERM/XrtA system glycosyltransferase [Sulfurimicrobium lacus]BCB26595.1 glycosyl transferase [Sulfurimicrobium lacus]